jgi:hypothetical protein
VQCRRLIQRTRRGQLGGRINQARHDLRHDLIHDRTMNGLNAGCVNLIEDNLAHRGVFQHGKNALLFRYEDDSLQECLDIVCNEPERAYSIATGIS